jgi:DNA (cytosine-5)-methyltransferase 1
MSANTPIPVIDLFAGPGGLGEGFSSARVRSKPRFRLALSVECDPHAHKTLELRAFCREFTRSDRKLPKAYFEFLREEISREELFKRHPDEAEAARLEAMQATLGESVSDRSIATRLDELESQIDFRKAVMIGGPPCQAYSLVGRSRMAKARASGAYREEEDGRHVLYRQYLKLIQRIKPAAFVIENVRGILSSRYQGRPIFQQILDDLSSAGYDLHALGDRSGDTIFSDTDPKSFLVMASKYGVPQRRARVFIVGTRRDLRIKELRRPEPLREVRPPTVESAIGTLPRVRSGLSGGDDEADWKAEVRECAARLAKEVPRSEELLRGVLMSIASSTSKLPSRRSERRVPGYGSGTDEFVLNHETRGHIPSDLERYLFFATWGRVRGQSPTLLDLPPRLLPDHENVRLAAEAQTMDELAFTDRFRVQVENEPSSTITSHISKDGHHFIHPDPRQCRSLTVREAARLQTFPDDYFFCGPRTEQYRQVGNAVPPVLAEQIAKCVLNAVAP